MAYSFQTDGAIQVHGQANASFDGAALDFPRTSKLFKSVALASGTAETTIWTPASGKKFRLLRLVLTVSAQTVLTFRDNTTGAIILVLELAANTPFALDLGGFGLLSATANNVLTVTRATAATLNGFVAGVEE